MPLPGPPAENEPPPPIMVFKTVKAKKSGSSYGAVSMPTEMCTRSGRGVGPGLMRGSILWS